MNDRLYRSVDDRVLAGVCAGLADRLDTDPALVRIGYAILALLTGVFPLLVLYVIMVVVIPEEHGWTGVRPVGPPPATPGWPIAGTPTTGMPADAPRPTSGSAGDVAGPAGSAGTRAVPDASGAAPGWIPPGASSTLDAGSWRDQRRADRAARHAERAARRAERRSDPLPAIIAGLFLVALGAFFLLRRTFDIDWAVVWPVAVVALGVVILVAAVRPRSG